MPDDMMPIAAGHNSGEIDFDLVLDCEVLLQRLTEEYASLTKRRDELIAGLDRFTESTKDGITDQDTADRAANMYKKLDGLAVTAESARVLIKKPIDNYAAVPQAFFKASIIDKMDNGKKLIKARMDGWQGLKARRAREALAAEAKKAQEAAALLAAEAAKRPSEANVSDAIAAEEAATTATHRAQHTKPAELTRSTSSLGAVTTTAQVWKWEVTDISIVPIEYIMANDPKVKAELSTNAAIKKSGAQPIRGIRFYAEEQARIR